MKKLSRGANIREPRKILPALAEHVTKERHSWAQLPQPPALARGVFYPSLLLAPSRKAPYAGARRAGPRGGRTPIYLLYTPALAHTRAQEFILYNTLEKGESTRARKDYTIRLYEAATNKVDCDTSARAGCACLRNLFAAYMLSAREEDEREEDACKLMQRDDDGLSLYVERVLCKLFAAVNGGNLMERNEGTLIYRARR